MWALLIAILIPGVLIILHELGHFLVARWFGVRVLRFSMGFGPRLWTWQRGETEYAVSAIPLGGYVKMAGEQRGEQSFAPWEYLSKPAGVRALIVFAGPFVNYLVAVISLWLVFVIGYPELLPVVGSAMPDMPAAAAQLQPGDRIRAIDGKPVATWEDMTREIYAAPERPLELAIEREGAVRTVTLTPIRKEIVDPFGQPKTIGLIGIAPSGAFESFRVGPVEAIGKTFARHAEWISQTFMAIWSMMTGRLSMRDSMTGPIGIVYLTSTAVSSGLGPVLFLASLFSLNLGLFNLFPLPVLDGGHLLFLFLEFLRGRPVSVNVQERSAQVTFVLLMLLVLVVCINDISRFGLVDKLMQLMQR